MSAVLLLAGVLGRFQAAPPPAIVPTQIVDLAMPDPQIVTLAMPDSQIISLSLPDPQVIALSVPV